LTISCPRTCAEPLVGSSNVVSILTVVVFPAPLGPSNPNSSPDRTLKLIPSTAMTSFVVRRKTPSVVLNTRRSSLTDMASVFFSNGLPHEDGCIGRVRMLVLSNDGRSSWSQTAHLMLTNSERWSSICLTVISRS